MSFFINEQNVSEFLNITCENHKQMFKFKSAYLQPINYTWKNPNQNWRDIFLRTKSYDSQTAKFTLKFTFFTNLFI